MSGKDSDVLSKLEMEYEVQKQITKAKLKLSNDETIPKNVRKKHKEDYSKAHIKVEQPHQRAFILLSFYRTDYAVLDGILLWRTHGHLLIQSNGVCQPCLSPWLIKPLISSKTRLSVLFDTKLYLIQKIKTARFHYRLSILVMCQNYD